jgi:hypothetical protein
MAIYFNYYKNIEAKPSVSAHDRLLFIFAGPVRLLAGGFGDFRESFAAQG